MYEHVLCGRCGAVDVKVQQRTRAVCTGGRTKCVYVYTVECAFTRAILDCLATRATNSSLSTVDSLVDGKVDRYLFPALYGAAVPAASSGPLSEVKTRRVLLAIP